MFRDVAAVELPLVLRMNKEGDGDCGNKGRNDFSCTHRKRRAVLHARHKHDGRVVEATRRRVART